MEILIAVLDKCAIAFVIAGALAWPLFLILLFRSYRLPARGAFERALRGGFRHAFPLLDEGPALRCCRFMFIAFFCGLVLVCAVTSLARREILRFIEGGEQEKLIVKANGQAVPQPEQYLLELARIRRSIAHRFHPDENRIRVEMTRGKQSMTLELVRDSAEKNEYLVFYPKYTTTAMNEVGRIRTSVFDEY